MHCKASLYVSSYDCWGVSLWCIIPLNKVWQQQPKSQSPVVKHIGSTVKLCMHKVFVMTLWSKGISWTQPYFHAAKHTNFWGWLKKKRMKPRVRHKRSIWRNLKSLGLGSVCIFEPVLLKRKWHFCFISSLLEKKKKKEKAFCVISSYLMKTVWVVGYI